MATAAIPAIQGPEGELEVRVARKLKDDAAVVGDPRGPPLTSQVFELSLDVVEICEQTATVPLPVASRQGDPGPSPDRVRPGVRLGPCVAFKQQVWEMAPVVPRHRRPP